MGITMIIKAARHGTFIPIFWHEICAELWKHWHNYEPFKAPSILSLDHFIILTLTGAGDFKSTLVPF